jgi:hypothetical protein
MTATRRRPALVGLTGVQPQTACNSTTTSPTSTSHAASYTRSTAAVTGYVPC